MIFRMSVPLAQIADGTIARHPSRKGDGLVAKRHPFEQVAKPSIPYCGNRRFLNQHMGSMNRTEQKPASFAVGISDLNMLTESLQRVR